ncbi:MAG: hypothetical protein HKN43_09935, partial [Rhodothermales bacterium]|nr:hypothetical protein [Rhodothermales bacterium]
GLFQETRKEGCDLVGSSIRDSVISLEDGVAEATLADIDVNSSLLDSLETNLFKTAARVAACPEIAGQFAVVVGQIREAVKSSSVSWDITSNETRQRLYRLLYGSRTALEEVLVQAPDSVDALQLFDVPPAATPSAVVQGVRIHSGDILVSRGGYPTSALISRGSDFPGNFSHVALAHVNEAGEVSVIEAHIEVGVTVASAEKYLADKKLRLMVLRLRKDIPQIMENPDLPHQAAQYAMDRTAAGHIPYDFSMNYEDPSRLFCSEVASDAYGHVGVDLWMGISTISSPGLRSWLSAFGVEYFETQEPSDVEYDPQVQIVAEWRDHEALINDRIDNAVVDAMLEGAERGDRLGYPWYELPVGRIAKIYSRVANMFGQVGPVPEGMSATAALRNKSYTATHQRLAGIVAEEAGAFRVANGYEPPYWQLVEIARNVVEGD